MENNKLFHDFSVLPGLYGDFGHYLLCNPDHLYQDKNITDWRKRIIESGRPMISYVDIVDKQLCMYSMVESLVKEDGKFRAYLHPNRVSQHCHEKEIISEFEAFCGRFILRTFQKYNLKNNVHTDFLWIGSKKYGLGTEHQRKDDLNLIKKVKSILSGQPYLEPNVRYVSINAKAEYTSPFFSIDSEKTKQKQIWAEDTKDLSMVWQIGHKRRKLLREKQIYSYEDDKFLEVVSNHVGNHYYKTIKKMMELNTSDQVMDFPSREEMESNFPSLFLESLDKFLFVDFETDFQKCIYMFGYSQLNLGYQNEWANDLTIEAERELMHRIFNVVHTHYNNGGLVVYFYAEDMFWRERCKLHNLLEYYDLFSQAIDLHKIFVKSPLIIKGVFNFKLKSIAKGLFRLGYIPISQPDGCADGAESVTIAKKWFSSHQQEYKDVLEAYNKFDCDVLLEITKFLRECSC